MDNNLKEMAADIAELKEAILCTKTVFSPKEAAKYIGIAQSTLYKLTSSGILPFSKPNGKLIYFSKEGLDNWLLANPSKSIQQTDQEASTYISTHS